MSIRSWSGSPYTACIYAGLAVGFIQAEILGVALGGSVAVITVIAAAAIASFFALAMLTKLVCGREILVYYHHAIVAVGTGAVVAGVLGEPVLAYLDLTALSIGTVIAIVRVGCLMVGCCHGRPSRVGVRYTEEHEHAGFPYWYVGVRVLPTQALEALWVVVIVVVGAVRILAGSAPGSTFAWYFVMYAVGRFLLEFLRGDSGRFYVGGLSQAQITSFVAIGLVWFGSRREALPDIDWHGPVLSAVAVVAVGAVASRLRGLARGR